MYKIIEHKDAIKVLGKTQKIIKKKYFEFYKHLQEFWTENCPFEIDTMKWVFKKNRYLEVKLHKDFRVIFRQEWNIIYIVRYAWTHNQLWTW